MGQKRTRFASMAGVRVPIVGTVGAGGVVTLFDTPAARRLADPPLRLTVVREDAHRLKVGDVVLDVRVPVVRLG